MFDLSRHDLDALRAAWSSAVPFSHAVLDDLLDDEATKALLEAFDDEPAHPMQDEIFDVLASAPTPEHASFRRFHAQLGSPKALEAIAAITGRTASRADLRAYAYQAGHYLLPHADHAADGSRLVAYAYYLASLPDERGQPFEGGELELFGCELRDGAERTTAAPEDIVSTEPVTLIEPVANRLVLFEVGPCSLHQVREVLSGTRLSLTGWFRR